MAVFIKVQDAEKELIVNVDTIRVVMESLGKTKIVFDQSHAITSTEEPAAIMKRIESGPYHRSDNG